MARLTIYERLVEAIDRLRWRYWLRFNNGSAQLQSAYEAVDDVGDCLDAVRSAIEDGDEPEALKLIALSREALQGHINTLKGLL